jgi:hypothetical protein
MSMLLPTKGNLPVSASNSMTANAYQSLLSLRTSPAACSGAMYASVPEINLSVDALQDGAFRGSSGGAGTDRKLDLESG